VTATAGRPPVGHRPRGRADGRQQPTTTVRARCLPGPRSCPLATPPPRWRDLRFCGASGAAPKSCPPQRRRVPLAVRQRGTMRTLAGQGKAGREARDKCAGLTRSRAYSCPRQPAFVASAWLRVSRVRQGAPKHGRRHACVHSLSAGLTAYVRWTSGGHPADVHRMTGGCGSTQGGTCDARADDSVSVRNTCNARALHKVTRRPVAPAARARWARPRPPVAARRCIDHAVGGLLGG
jgi:hypothetical protein